MKRKSPTREAGEREECDVWRPHGGEREGRHDRQPERVDGQNQRGVERAKQGPDAQDAEGEEEGGAELRSGQECAMTGVELELRWSWSGVRGTPIM